jgi:putative PEP-CTERM system histidine kinase
VQGLTIGYVSYGSAAAAYAGLALYYLLRGRWGAYGPFFLAAVGLSLAWALVALSGHGVIPRHAEATMFVQQVAMLAWLWFLWRVIASLEPYQLRFPRRLRFGRWLIIGICVATLLLNAANVLGALGWMDFGVVSFNTAHLSLVIGLAIAVFGLSLTETLYRGYLSAERWGVKFLCLGLGGLFAYDVFLYGEGLLFRVLDPAFLDVRGLAQALVVPFLVINIQRSEARHFGLGLSQRLVFGSTVVVGAGIYLAIMATAAFYVQAMGGAWGSAVQIVFLFVALMLLASFLLSGTFRALVRGFLSRHVMEDRYDYRDEWLRFSARLAATDTDESFERRVIRALADIVDSPAGALWHVGENHLPIAAAWNLSPASVTALDMAEVEEFLKTHDTVRDLTRNYGDSDEVPAAFDHLLAILRGISDAWALVPLLHQDRVVALLLLTHPRARRDLAPEDGELLGAAARQAAGLLAERGLARDVAEAGQFERFNQRYAFVAHDLKNLVSQLSLVVRNHERFGDRPDFQADMIETIQSAVARMERVMNRLSGASETGADPGDGDTALIPLLREISEQNDGRVATLELAISEDSRSVHLKAESARIESMLRHLLQNAVEAAGADGTVTVTVRAQGSQVIVEVVDDGPGMAARFVEEELFKPFQSTKSGGFGIGAYQCRVLARELGGELDAVSAPGSGTTMRLSLPRDPYSMEPSGQSGLG